MEYSAWAHLYLTQWIHHWHILYFLIRTNGYSSVKKWLLCSSTTSQRVVPKSMSRCWTATSPKAVHESTVSRAAAYDHASLNLHQQHNINTVLEEFNKPETHLPNSRHFFMEACSWNNRWRSLISILTANVVWYFRGYHQHWFSSKHKTVQVLQCI